MTTLIFRVLVLFVILVPITVVAQTTKKAAARSSAPSFAQNGAQTIDGWSMQDVAKVPDGGAVVSTAAFHPQSWYAATVPGTVLTTLVNNGVYPDPLYGENMRAIPESLNKTSYWYRTTFAVPAAYQGRHIWLRFGGVNYSAQIWVNGRQAGEMRGAFIRGDFDISELVKPGTRATVAVLVAPQPHPGIPHEHTVALGVGQNGGDTAIDGPTFLSTIGWDWLPAVRDRDTGIWLPVTLGATGDVLVKDPFITTDLAASHATADLAITASLKNISAKPVSGTLTGVIHFQNVAARHVRAGYYLSQRGDHWSEWLRSHRARQQIHARPAAQQPAALVAQRLWPAKSVHADPKLRRRQKILRHQPRNNSAFAKSNTKFPAPTISRFP